MSGSQQLAGAMGVGLIAANLWTGPQHTQLADLFTTQGDPAAAHPALKTLGLEILGVGALVLVAGSSEGAGHIAVIVLVALWVLWLFRRSGHPARPSTPQGTAGAFQFRPV